MIQARYMTKDEWKQMSSNAHMLAFNETWNEELERIDFAMLLVKDEEPVAYATLKEDGEKSIYIQYGGAFPNARQTVVSYKAFARMVDELLKNYKKITTLVENNNWGMLKYYWSARFKVTGIRYFKNLTFLEMTFESETH